MNCVECKRSRMRIKEQRESSRLFIACMGYPGCRAALNLPKSVEEATVLDELCPECIKQGQRVFLLKLDFDGNFVNEDMSEVLAYEDNTSGHFCVVCDPAYQQLIEATRNLAFKRTYSDAF